MNTVFYANIGSVEQFAEKMNILKSEAAEIFQQSLYDSLNGQVSTEMKRRIPLATIRRYNRTYDKSGKEIKSKRKKKNKTTGNMGSLRKSFRLEIKGTEEINIGTTAPYSNFVHERKKPVEGHYWEAGKDGGWTTKGTGNKFIEKPLNDHKSDIHEWIKKGIDKRLRERGII